MNKISLMLKCKRMETGQRTLHNYYHSHNFDFYLTYESFKDELFVVFRILIKTLNCYNFDLITTQKYYQEYLKRHFLTDEDCALKIPTLKYPKNPIMDLVTVQPMNIKFGRFIK